ncbi:MAG TPA: hypothetical protein VE736_10905 [Gaiellaceae bacterium]|jgi:hypothetical protein|nr:hypothetical protein [Gaiellaceae bacterium]
MKHRLAAVLAVFVLALTVTASAFAFDCIRVSSSLQGLQQSTRTGNWTLFDFSSGPALQSSVANGFGVTLTPEQAACVAGRYAASGQPLYFALGTGVAGGKKTSTNSQGARSLAEALGVIAWNNPNDSVLANGKGIDHLDDSPIFGALMSAAAACGVS